MARDREIADLQVRDHSMYADISPGKVQKHKALKPILQTLIAKNTKYYYWAFSFRLNFTYHNKKH